MKDRLTILCGDALEQLKTLPDESVHCCVTSPPYWGLRDYGVPGQLGLEKTPEEYVAKMVEIFLEVKRVLRKDGTCWVNLGDSYNAGRDGGHAGGKNGISRPEIAQQKSGVNAPGLKPKDLCGIPWRVAFALQNDGWYLRSDIIWHKPNPMPESVTDRPTKSHEYIFLLSKNERYYYDGDAVREPYNPDSLSRYESPLMGTSPGARQPNGDLDRREREKGVRDPNPMGRNKRTVWTVPSFAFPESHFATYPPNLIKPCIMAGTSAKGCCEKCGAPWERQFEVNYTDAHKGMVGNQRKKISDDHVMHSGRENDKRMNREVTTTCWQPTCDHNAGVIPCTVLDPFGGSGTTGMVALELGRKAILIELNPEYVHLIKQRCDVTPGLPLA